MASTALLPARLGDVTRNHRLGQTSGVALAVGAIGDKSERGERMPLTAYLDPARTVAVANQLAAPGRGDLVRDVRRAHAKRRTPARAPRVQRQH